MGRESSVVVETGTTITAATTKSISASATTLSAPIVVVEEVVVILRVTTTHLSASSADTIYTAEDNSESNDSDNERIGGRDSDGHMKYKYSMCLSLNRMCPTLKLVNDNFTIHITMH